MEMCQAAGCVNINSDDEIKMTEKTTMTEALETVGGLGFDSRDRRKSKYLSSPYTNIKSRHKVLPDETEDVRTPCLSPKAEASTIATNSLNGSSFAKLGGKRFRRNWYRKFISCSAISSSPEFINASSDELLSGLYSKAVDCMFPIEKKSFDLVEWFFCRYRVSKYHDEAELATSLVNVKGGNLEKPVGNDLQDIKTEKKKRKNNKMESAVKLKMKSLSGLSDVNISSSTDNSLRPGRKLKGKKVEEVISSHKLQNDEITLNESGSKYSSVPEAPQSLTCIDSEGKDGSKKRNKIEAAPEHPSSTDNSLRPGRKLKGKKVEEVISSHKLQNDEITLNESGSKYSSVPEAPQSLTCIDSEGKDGSKKRKKIEAAPEHPSAQIASAYTDAKSTKCCSLVVDLQHISPPTPGGIPQKSNGENKEELVLMGSNPELSVSQGGIVGNITNYGLSVSSMSEVGTVSVNRTGLNRMETVSGGHLNTKLATEIPDLNGTSWLKNRTEKVSGGHLNTKLATEIPDLNGTSSESNSIINELEKVNSFSPEANSELPRSLSACVRPTKTTNYSRVEDNGETLKTCLFLRFAPGAHVPSKQDLLATFCQFGPLKASETQLLKDTGSAQVVFVRGADAREAFCSLEQNKPFGADLVDYKLHHLSAASPLVEQFKTPTQPPIGSMPMPGEGPPPLHFIRQNLQMMTSMLENSGNNLSPQMRARLDSEIKNLLKKVNSKACS